MGKKNQTDRWSIGRRLQFIDFRLFWEGQINRSDLVSFFKISVPQASADLAQYQEFAKNNAVYDKSLKTYVAGPKFNPVFFQPSADQYLAQLRQIESGFLPEEEGWVINLPSYSIVPILRRKIDPMILREIIKAIRNQLSIKVDYQSMSATRSTSRWISPHALGFDGFRWHARAWCYRRDSFRDFVLSRFVSLGESKSSTIDPMDDVGWQRKVTLCIGPNPDVTGGARKTIELDYGMTAGRLEIETRVCLAFYCLRHFGLENVAESKSKSNGHQHLALLNYDELENAMRETGVTNSSDSGE